jgi:hypothetical protein
MSVWTIVYLGGCAVGPTLGGSAIGAFGPRGAFLIVGAAGLCGAAAFCLLAIVSGPPPQHVLGAEAERGLEPPAHVT